MQARSKLLVSLLLSGAHCAAALADPAAVNDEKKKSTATRKQVKREQVEKRQVQQPAPAPRTYQRGDKDPKRVQRKEQAPPPAKREQIKRREAVPRRGDERVMPPYEKQRPGVKERAPRPERYRERYGDGPGDAPRGRVERPRPEEISQRPLPTFLKERDPGDMKKQLPKQRLSGTIESIDGDKALIRTRDGKRAKVQLAPQSYMRQKGYDLKPGQEVNVDGWGEWGREGDAEGFFFAGGIYGPGFFFEFADDRGYPYWADPNDYYDGWCPSWDAYYVYFWGPPPWWAYAPPPAWYYYGPPPRWWHHRHHWGPPPPYWRHRHRWY